MRTLRFGMTGEDVSLWQTFLLGGGADQLASGIFDQSTVDNTRVFQKSRGLVDDGVVGRFTYGAAMLEGYAAEVEDEVSNSLSWPKKIHENPSAKQTDEWFGPIQTMEKDGVLVVTARHPNYKILNLRIQDEIRAIAPCIPKTVLVHQFVAAPFLELLYAWKDAGILNQVLTWGGMHNVRAKRGSGTLSEHAYAIAFDINVAWNLMGRVPPAAGKLGSVRELAAIAINLGWFWGGHYRNTPDGMHFRYIKPKSEANNG